jgi:hypothetical protein
MRGTPLLDSTTVTPSKKIEKPKKEESGALKRHSECAWNKIIHVLSVAWESLAAKHFSPNLFVPDATSRDLPVPEFLVVCAIVIFGITEKLLH